MNEFAEIDITGMKPQELKDQPAPQLVWAPIEDLVIDRTYQRDISGAGRRLISEIAAAFDWARCAPILLAALPGGKFAIVDGQHRAHAARLCGIEALPAMVVPMSVRQQAAAFAAVNTKRVGVSAQSVYRAAFAAGEDWALACHAAVHKAGCRMATFTPTSTARRPRFIYATSLIKRMVAVGEADAVSNGLAAVVASEQADELVAYSGPTLTVWLSALATNQRFFALDLPQIFDGIDFEELGDACRIQARQSGKSGRALAIEHVGRLLIQSLDKIAA